MEWHYARSGAKKGPLTSEEIRALAASGGLQPTDMVWHPGLDKWQMATEIPGLLLPPPLPGRSEAQAIPKSANGASRPLPTKWISFLTHFSLPVGGVIGLVNSIGLLRTAGPVGAYLLVVSVSQLVLAYGLHHRRLWAWKANWFFIALGYLYMIVSTGVAVPRDPASLAGHAIGAGAAGWLLWMWPNLRYFRRRRFLFE